jgi:hypothetical protein
MGDSRLARPWLSRLGRLWRPWQLPRLRGVLRHRGLILAVAALACALSGCSFDTEYAFRVEPLGFVPEEDRTAAFTLPPTEAVDIYLLPYLQVFPSGTIPDLEFRQAYPVAFPKDGTDALADLPEDAALRLSIEGETQIANNATAGALPEGTARVYLAPLGTERVYQDGEVIADAVVPSVGAGSTGTVRITTTLPIDPELARSDGVQVGIRLRIPAAAPELGALDAAVTQTELVIELSAVPFRALP